MKSKKSLIGFGDSLTWGYYCSGDKSHPYSIKLNSFLKENNFNYEAENYGVNGEITLEMKERLIDQFEPEFSGKANTKGTPFSNENYIFIIFGGTNDIAYSIPAIEVVENLKKMSEFLTKYKMNHFIVTLPANQCDLSVGGKYTKKRQEINNLIRKTWNKKEHGFLFDLDKEIRYLDYSEEMRREIWDDQLHFSEKGYDLLGEIIFNKIKHLLV